MSITPYTHFRYYFERMILVLKMKGGLTEFHTQFPPTLNSHFFAIDTTTFARNRMSHNARMEAALAELEGETKPNFSEMARKHNLERTTLSKRFYGKTTSREEA